MYSLSIMAIGDSLPICQHCRVYCGVIGKLGVELETSSPGLTVLGEYFLYQGFVCGLRRRRKTERVVCPDRVKDNAVVEMQGCCCGWWHGIAVIVVAAVIDRIYLFEWVEVEQGRRNSRESTVYWQ